VSAQPFDLNPNRERDTAYAAEAEIRDRRLARSEDPNEHQHMPPLRRHEDSCLQDATCECDSDLIEDRHLEALECKGHPAGPLDPMGQTVYCDGTCSQPARSEGSR